MRLKQRFINWLFKEDLGYAHPRLNDEDMKRLYDFFQNHNGTIEHRIIPNDVLVTAESGTSVEHEKPTDGRKEVRPKDVFDELERVPNPIDLDPKSIAAKIELMQRKIDLGDYQFYTKQQMEGMIMRLENRKNYNKHKDFFESFAYTTQDKIDNLLLKYKLQMKKSTLFVPTFPKQAVEVMERYKKAVYDLTNKYPVFYVIAPEKDFKAKERKLDPILLAQSPFGFFWQILGAWDEEMQLLEEL